MGRKTQITKEIILEAALQMLIREGYAAINIKSLAKEIGCSTQPIVWHFENMQHFRQEFFHYCICYAKEQFTVWNGSLDDLLAETARGYVTIACNMPHLFRFVFVDNKDECKNSDIIQELQLDNTKKIIHLLCQEKGLTEAQAASFLMDYEFYIHGIASYTARGFCHYSEEEVIRMVNRAKEAFLANELGQNSNLGVTMKYRLLHLHEAARIAEIDATYFIKNVWRRDETGEYISAHSSVETQAFYKAMGCVEAEEYSQSHVEKEPCDCQLELILR